MSLHSPVCVKCAKIMRCSKNEFPVSTGGEFFSGDAYKCGGCGLEVVIGFGGRMQTDSARDGEKSLEVNYE